MTFGSENRWKNYTNIPLLIILCSTKLSCSGWVPWQTPCLLQSCLTSIFHQFHSIVGIRAQSAEDWRSSAFHQIRCGVTIPGTLTTVTFKGFPEGCQDLSVGHSPRVSEVALRAEVEGSYKLQFHLNFQWRCFRLFQHS
jgi:hypothetical protein